MVKEHVWKFSLPFFFVLSTQSVKFLFPSSKRHFRIPKKKWRSISTVLFHKQAHQILQLLSCMSRSTYDRNFTNPSSNFSFFRDLCTVTSDYYCQVILAPLSIYQHFLIFCFFRAEEEYLISFAHLIALPTFENGAILTFQ